MVFSSSVFLFLFLPAVLFFYYVMFKKSRQAQNILLTLASLAFYAWGEPLFVAIMLGSIVVNWLLGLQVSKYSEDGKAQKVIIVVAFVINVGILFIFKYLSFFVNTVAGYAVLDIALPIGISFFTFQALSYVLDVQRGHGQARKSPLDVALYISFFPQLIAGPIVRYETIAEQISNRKETLADFNSGVTRFVIGLAKKVLLANALALVADSAFNNDERTFVMAWLGAFAYTFQILFDFSGYSDMAIGLGRMFGFNFNENFNYPYISKSITEFWRRWHISLGTWFRDYVYFPLGGSRVKTKTRLVINLFIVWFLTGVWHGANLTFFLWGIMYFILIALEKMTAFHKKLGLLGHIYTMIFVIFGWVLFRAENLTSAFQYLQTLSGIGITGFSDSLTAYWFHEYRIQFFFALLFSFPIAKWIGEKAGKRLAANIAHQILMCALLLLTIISMLSSNYNPFIYFNF